MGFNFPSSPTIGQLHPPTATPGLPQYTWDGVTWTMRGTPINPKIIVSDTPPASPETGSMWWNGSNGKLYVYYFDGDASFWVQAAASLSDVDQSQLLKKAGDAMAGPLSLIDPTLQMHAMPFGYIKRNRVINGAMQVSQENGSTLGTAASYYPVDQFVSYHQGGTRSTQQVASLTPGGSPNRIRITTTSAYPTLGTTDFHQIRHPIEGSRIADFRMGTALAKTVTLQFGCKGPAGTYCISFRNAPTYNRTHIKEYTITASEANIDVVKSVTLTLDTIGTWPSDNTQGLEVAWLLAGGSTYITTPNSWQAGAYTVTANQLNFMAVSGNVFELFDVDLFEGTAPRAYLVPDYSTTLLECMRYFRKHNAVFVSGYNGAGAAVYISSPIAPPMRIAPAVSTWNTTFYSNASNATPNLIFADLFRWGVTISAAGYGYADISPQLNSRM